MPENLVSRDGFSRPVPRQPAHLHTQAESGAYLRDSSRVPPQRPSMKPSYAIGSVPSLSGHAIAYGCRSLLRVRRHRASIPQGSSERVLPWQVTMDQLTFAFLSHTHHWYEVDMLKVPAATIIYLKQCWFLARPSLYVWSTLSAEYDLDQPGVIASLARGHLKKSKGHFSCPMDQSCVIASSPARGHLKKRK